MAQPLAPVRERKERVETHKITIGMPPKRIQRPADPARIQLERTIFIMVGSIADFHTHSQYRAHLGQKQNQRLGCQIIQLQLGAVRRAQAGHA